MHWTVGWCRGDHRTALLQAEQPLGGMLGATCSPPYSLTTNTFAGRRSRHARSVPIARSGVPTCSFKSRSERDSYRILLLSHRQCRPRLDAVSFARATTSPSAPGPGGHRNAASRTQHRVPKITARSRRYRSRRASTASCSKWQERPLQPMVYARDGALLTVHWIRSRCASQDGRCLFSKVSPCCATD